MTQFLTLPIARFQTKSTILWKSTEKTMTLQKVGGFSMEILTMFSLSYRIMDYSKFHVVEDILLDMLIRSGGNGHVVVRQIVVEMAL